ncbi:hypothetical protein HAX54_031004 [Datura stramonium]|uniref:Uncharacterized protein n=1 Tax=Datura stramonium TaxID=4076 RepID=A0ABS8RLP2_DATST|nr:hypothetical protein [Datura stramonium]
MPQVFGPNWQTVRAAAEHTDASVATTGSDLTFVITIRPTPIASTFSAATTTQGMNSTETSSAAPQTSLAIKFCVVKKAEKYEKQIRLFIEQLGTFVDRVISTALVWYEGLHARIDNMEARERSAQVLPNPIIEESEVEEPYIDLLSEHSKASSKLPQEGDEEKEKSKRRKHRKKTKSKVDDYVSGAEIALESQTLITPPPATEVVPNVTMSASVTVGATIDVSGATAAYSILPDLQT